MMKKKLQFICWTVILMLIGGFFGAGKKEEICFRVDEGGISFLLTVNNRQEILYPWFNEDDGRHYFFLPAFCNNDDIHLKRVGGDKTVFINEKNVKSNSKLKWQEDEVYHIEILSEKTTEIYDVVVLQSKNLPAVFIETDSGNMDYIHADKNNEDMGNMDIITENGGMEYSGRLKRISGRGNSTWQNEKKPYAIKLADDRPLLGMDASDKWCLLSGFGEGAKMNSKVAFDIAEMLDLDYSPQCTWIDLYLNGEYRGIYFLMESVSVGKGRVDITDLEKQNKAYNPNIEEAETFEENGMRGYMINSGDNISGGYLLEKDAVEYWVNEGAGFSLSGGNKFTVKSPQHASREQVEYISQYVRNIDDLINEGNTEYRNYIDFESFARKFIVDELALSFDVNVTSMFYYKEKDDDLLYAGPVWDFDETFGEGNGGHIEGHGVDYTWSITYPFRDRTMTLNWYAKLYKDEVFKSRMIEIYSDILPDMEELIETKIDEYADYIRKSVELDKLRWGYIDIRGGHPGNYVEFDNNVRYLKYYLGNRLNYLNERWEVEYYAFPLPDSQGVHEVTFWMDGELIETREVVDGDIMEELPYLDENVFWGWYFTYSAERYRVHLPIYEDVAFYARRI